MTGLREFHGGAARQHTIFNPMRHAVFRLFRTSRCTTRRPSRCPAPRREIKTHDVLHVRLPLRHPRPPARRRAALHRRQPEPPDQQGRDLRQGRVRDHEAGVAGAAARGRCCARPGSERGAGEFEPISWDARSRSSKTRLAKIRADRSEEVRALHRPRPDAGADRPVRAPVRHAELRGARRLLLGQHGRRHDLHDRRQRSGSSAAPTSTAPSCS